MRVLGVVLTVLILVGLGAAGLALLQQAVTQGDSLIIPFVLLAIPLVGIGTVLVATLAAIVPGFRYGHDRAQTVIAVSVAVILGVVVYDLNSHVPTRRPDAAVTAAVGAACGGRAVPLAGTVHADGSTRNHLVVLDAAGAEQGWTGKPDVSWRPPTVDDVELVACVDTEDTYTVVEVCPYIAGPDTTRYEAARDVRVVAARSAAELARFTITNAPADCSKVKLENETELRAGGVSWEQVEAHLASLVRNGTFIDPDPPEAIEQPGSSFEPAGSEAPAASEEPAAEAKAVVLQKALADGLVTAKGIGDGLQSLDLRVTSKATESLRVVVNAGTYLDPGKKATQTMVVITTTSIDLEPGGTATESLDVACAQMHDDQPSGSDTFKVRSKVATGDLRKLLAGDAFGAADFRIQQFAIWTITNNPTRSGYVGIGSFGVGSGPDTAEFREIKGIFRNAGVDPADYRALK